MKKILCIVICFIICFTLQGCAEKVGANLRQKTEWQVENYQDKYFYVCTKDSINGYYRESSIDWEKTSTLKKLNISVEVSERVVIFSSPVFNNFPQRVKITLKRSDSKYDSTYWGDCSYGIISLNQFDSSLIYTYMLLGDEFEIIFSTNEKECKYVFDTKDESYKESIRECYKKIQ